MDTKSANRVAWARTEGIYEAVVQSGGGQRLRCVLCAKEIGTNAVVRAAHGKKHVREGEAVTRTEYGYDGPRTIYERLP